MGIHKLCGILCPFTSKKLAGKPAGEAVRATVAQPLSRRANYAPILLFLQRLELPAIIWAFCIALYGARWGHGIDLAATMTILGSDARRRSL